MKSFRAVGIALVAALGLGAPPAPAALAPVVGTVAIPRHSEIARTVKQAADYYRPLYAMSGGVRNGWSWSTYFQGVHTLFRTTGDQRYLDDAMAWGRSTGWAITTAEANPDSVKAGQTYYDLNRIDPAASLSAMDARMAADLTGLPVASYTWADALFMGLPNWTRWATRTGNGAHLDKMDALYAWARDNGITSACAGSPLGLYDVAERLWYRDCRFITRRDAAGRKVFWARGNAWVLAAMAQVLATLPPGDPRAAGYVQMLRDMASRVAELQGSDGFWRSNLLDPAAYPQPETSSTALFTSAIATGVATGFLDRATYVPVVAKAWTGLATTAVRPTGFASSCQPGGDQPAASYAGSAPRVAPTATSPGTVLADSPPFCVGAVLLAGGAVAQLTPPMSTGHSVQATAQQAGNEAHRAVDGGVATRWSANGFPQSVTVDLGTFHRASNALVVPYLERAYRYRIDTSADGTTWQTVVDRTSNTATGSRADDFSQGTVSLRYARLTVTGVFGVATTWVSIQEFAIHDRYDPRPGLTRGRPTTATSSQAGYPPSQATDARSSTFWVSAALPTASSPQLLTVDLQTALSVDTARIFSRAGYGPRDVDVLASTDGSVWTTVASATLTSTEGPHMTLFPPVTARWLRLRTTSSVNPANVQVEEFEAYAAR